MSLEFREFRRKAPGQKVIPKELREIFKISVDVAMTGVLLFLMSYSMIGDLTHEILGTAMLVLLIIHHILNLQWHKNLFKGKYTVFRIAQTVLSALVLLSVLGSAVSGIMMSRHVFRFLNITVGASFGRSTVTVA